jgi:hypothetical protein
MSKVSVAPDASSGVARSAIHTLLGARVAPSRAASLGGGGRSVRPFINYSDSHHMNESSPGICS